MQNTDHIESKIILNDDITFDDSYFNLISNNFENLQLPIKHAVYNYMICIQKHPLNEISKVTIKRVQEFIETNYVLCCDNKLIKEYHKESEYLISYANNFSELNNQLRSYNEQLLNAQKDLLTNRWYKFGLLSKKEKTLVLLSAIMKKIFRMR